MGYLGGFLVTFRQHGPKNRVTTQYSGGRMFRRKKRNAKKMDVKIDKPERLHGRHVLNRYEDGIKVHRVRIVLGGLSCEVHSCSWCRQQPDVANFTRRAIWVDLRDQLFALHSLRPVCRGMPN